MLPSVLRCRRKQQGLPVSIRDFTIKFIDFHVAALVVCYGLGSRETSARAWSDRWEHRGKRRALELPEVSVSMDSPLVCCREEDDYQRQFALLLAEVRRHQKVPTVVSPDLLALCEDFGHLHYVENVHTGRAIYSSSPKLFSTIGLSETGISSSFVA